MAFLQPSLRSLPFELIEEIIVITALLGDTRAAATLSQTCRSFRALVYHQFSKHLWREMFLVVFDNPFPARDVRTHGRAPLPHLNLGERKCLSEDVFPWEGEYKRRIWTESFILRRTRPPRDTSSSDLPSSDAEVHSALQTLLRIISTAAPLPYDALACMDFHPSPPPRPHPICPPLFLAAHMHPTLFLGSRNTTWLARVLAHGLPHALMARLTVFDEHGGVDVQKQPVKWDGFLAKLVAQIGLTTLIGTTISAEKEPRTTAIPPRPSLTSGDNNEDIVAEVTVPPVVKGVFGSIATPATTSLDGVRRLARIRVYNTAYLHPSRAFGPFLPADDLSSRPSCDKGFFADGEEDQGAEAGSSSTDIPPVPLIPDSTLFLGAFSDPEDDYDDDGISSGSDDDGDDDALPSGSSSVPDDQLRFDWAWIAAARQVIELNLRDLLMTRHRDVLRALLSLEGLRPCSVPGFPLAAPEWSPAAEGEGSGGIQYRDGEGWDWAGAEGQWRRCVCWLDYGDLLYAEQQAQPLARRFSHPALYEVMRIIPLTLRISHYTRAPAAWPGRPTIHVVGECHTATTPSVLTRMRGTVEMTASGDVRWTLTSSREDGEGEWASEGVQLGGRGSAIGVIGMWTGAGHEPSDPLGPFWAWKVGPATAVVAPTRQHDGHIPNRIAGGSASGRVGGGE
ncbi:hypothetical protein EDB89DRAFT_1856688 [Lactarius sanguifluus]|nr:hypothetical protein EDB89DRAFT_1856688 [Lactarius sanguifluus]